MRSRPTELFIVGALLALAGCEEEPPSASVAPAAPAETQPVPPVILQFYASPAAVPQGETTTLCYGVENADTVVLEPNIKAIKPGLNRCFVFAPRKGGVIKLTAAGPGGEAHREVAIEVVRAAEKVTKDIGDLVTVFAASQNSVPKGMSVTLCYAVEGADSVKIDPPVIELEPAARCFTTRVDRTTTYKITATNGGRLHSKSVEVRVQ